MTIYRPDILKRVFIFGVVISVILFLMSVWRDRVYLNYHFNGRVDSVRYGDKGTAVIIVRGQTYSMEDEWSYGQNNLIAKGDSIIKLKDSLAVTLIKPNGKIIKKTHQY